MVHKSLLTVIVLNTGCLDSAFRTDDDSELDLVDSPRFQVGPFIPLLSGLSKLPPLCGSKLFANINVHKTIRSIVLASKKGGGVIASSEFIDPRGWGSEAKSTIPVTPGMSLYAVKGEQLFAGPWTRAEQATEIINDQIRRRGSVEVVFDAGLDIRSCWGDMHDDEGMSVCGGAALSGLALALRTLPAKESNNLGKSGATIISHYPRFVFKSLSKESALIAGVVPNISSALMKFKGMYSGKYATGLTPMCVVVPGFDGTDWLLMRKVAMSGVRAIAIDGVEFLDLKGPKFIGMRDGKTYIDNTLYGGIVAKHKDPGFAAMFPTGVTVSSCGGREVAFSMEKDAGLLEALAMTDFSMFMKFYEAGSHSAMQCNYSERGATFPVILDVVKPFQFRVALGIIDYVEQTTNWLPASTMKKPHKYHEYWMHMWPNYFHLSNMSLQQYKGHTGFDSSRVVALTRLKWSDIKWGDEPFHRDAILEVKASVFTPGSAYKVLPGELGIVREEADRGLIVHWDKYLNELFWVEPQNVMPVPS